MSYLMDVNVLIALVDPSHQFHEAASRFFPIAQKAGWATCPLVQNAFIRILGHPSYRDGPGTPHLARQLLIRYIAAPGHQFWPDALSLCDLQRFPSLPGPQVLTDLYLLALAVKNQARFATLDKNIDSTLVPGGPAAHYLIPAS